MEPGGLCNARAMSLMDSPAFHRSHNSFLPAADNPPGRPSLATPAPPIRTTPKTLPCCTDRLNPPDIFFGKLSIMADPKCIGSRKAKSLGLSCSLAAVKTQPRFETNERKNNASTQEGTALARP